MIFCVCTRYSNVNKCPIFLNTNIASLNHVINSMCDDLCTNAPLLLLNKSEVTDTELMR